jgi:hypothetical protein
MFRTLESRNSWRFSQHDILVLFLQMNVPDFADSISLPFAMVVASKRNSGNTLLISQLIQELVKSGTMYAPVVYSNTAHLNGDYSFLPKTLVRPFNPANLKALMDKQSLIPKAERPALLVVFDDVLGDKSAQGNEEILYAYAMGRHINIHPILIPRPQTECLRLPSATSPTTSSCPA